MQGDPGDLDALLRALARSGVECFVTDATGRVLAARTEAGAVGCEIAGVLGAPPGVVESLLAAATASGGSGEATIRAPDGSDSLVWVDDLRHLPGVGGLLWQRRPADTDARLERLDATVRRIEGAIDARLGPARTPAVDDLAAEAELDARETLILRLFVLGLRPRAIAEQLHVSPSTVRNYLSQIYEKLGVSGQTELMEYVLRGRPAG